MAASGLSKQVSSTTAMDLATKFNDIGCAYYQEGCTEHAYDLFSGAMQALHYSAGTSSLLDEMDGISHQVRLTSPTFLALLTYFQMLLVDPTIQRAFDRIDNTPNQHLFTTSFDSSHPSRRSFNSGVDNNKKHKSTIAAESSQLGGNSHSGTDECAFQWKRVFSVDGLQCYDFDPAIYASILSASILFNQAIVLHTGGVPSSRRSFERALTMYSMAAKRLFDTRSTALLMANEFTMTLTCAVLNNTGYLLHQMGEHDGSKLCFTRLNEFLHQLPPPHSVQEKQRRDEFGLNILILWNPLSGAAAA